MMVAKAQARSWEWMLLRAAVTAAVGVLALSLIRDDGAAGFRQAQTAISIYWMVHGGPWLDYWTPILGYPWSVPFEFPFYQWQVAVVALAGPGVGRAGTLVSFAWLLLLLYPVNLLGRSYGLSTGLRRVLLSLVLLVPVYLDLGTAVWIELPALALALLWLAMLRQYLVSGTFAPLIVGTIFGVLGALTKVTTVAPYLALGAIMTIAAAWPLRRRPRAAATLLLGALAMTVPLVLATMAWNAHADALKALNPNAAILQSTDPVIIRWNFGTWDQRFGFGLVRVFARIAYYTFGPLAPLLAAGLLYGLWRQPIDRGRAYLVAALLVGFVAPILVFTNLYVVHGYYMAANVVVLVAAYVILLGEVEKARPALAKVLAIATAVSQIGCFVIGHRVPLLPHAGEERAMAVGRALRELTPRNSVTAIYGLDWSSVALFYAERKGVMELDWSSEADRRRRLSQLFQPVGGEPMAAVVHCPSSLDADPAFRSRFAAIAANHPARAVAGCVIYLAGR